MKYQHQPKVNPAIAAQSIRDIEAVNAFVDDVRGTVVTIQRIRSGQSRPYADSVDEAIIFCHQPNSLTTNAPMVRSITRDEAKTLARIFVGKWTEPVTHGLDTKLEVLEPLKNPCGLEEYENRAGEEPRASTWRVVIRQPYND
jgi:hypothetical protein